MAKVAKAKYTVQIGRQWRAYKTIRAIRSVPLIPINGMWPVSYVMGLGHHVTITYQPTDTDSDSIYIQYRSLGQGTRNGY